MTKNEAIELYKYLAVTFPRQYGNLTDAELAIVVDNLAYTFRYNTLDEVMKIYRDSYTRSKTAPHPSDILQLLNPVETEKRSTTLDPDTIYERLKCLPEYHQLVQSYGGDEKAERKVRRAAKLAVQTGTFKELLFRLENDD